VVRRGTDYTDRLTRIAEAVRGLPAERVLVDGEAVVFRDDGRSDFEALLTRRGGESASYVPFDLLTGEGLRLRPLEERRSRARRRRRLRMEKGIANPISRQIPELV
jgi:bifunctional non-homologous end joining protein LigD